MPILRIAVSMLSAALLIQIPEPASGQTFPSRPIRIVASAPGGNGDFMARVVAQESAAGFGQPVIVDNRSVVVRAPHNYLARG